MTRALAAALALALLSGCGGNSKRDAFKSDWEEKNARLLRDETPETVPPPPAFPSEKNLVRFFVSSASDFTYFVDRSSIKPEGVVVRYVLVSRSPSGVDNVAFEALNCSEREFRSYARGTNDGKWIVRPTEWRRTEPAQRAEHALHHQYFCPNNAPIHSAAEGVNALERGGHPWAVLPNTQGLQLQPNAR